MKEAQRLWGIQESMYQLSILSSPSFSLLCVLSSLMPPFVTLLAPLAFHSHLFLCFAPSLSLCLYFEYVLFSFALPSLTSCFFPSSFPDSYSSPLSPLAFAEIYGDL